MRCEGASPGTKRPSPARLWLAIATEIRWRIIKVTVTECRGSLQGNNDFDG
jgi:hypothetical protein